MSSAEQGLVALELADRDGQCIPHATVWGIVAEEDFESKPLWRAHDAIGRIRERRGEVTPGAVTVEMGAQNDPEWAKQIAGLAAWHANADYISFASARLYVTQMQVARLGRDANSLIDHYIQEKTKWAARLEDPSAVDIIQDNQDALFEDLAQGFKALVSKKFRPLDERGEISGNNGQDAETPEARPPEFPAELFGASPLFGLWRDWLGPTTEAPASFHFAGAMTALGCAVGHRAHVVCSIEQHVQFFTVLVGPPASRKSTVLDAATDVAFLTSPNLITLHGAGSAEGVIKALGDRSATDRPDVLLSFSDMGSTIKKVFGRASTSASPWTGGRGGSDPVGGGSSMYCNFFDAVHRNLENPTAKDGKEGCTKIVKPLIHMLGACTPDCAGVMVSDDAARSGFSSRVVFYCGEPESELPVPPRPDESLKKEVTKRLNMARETCSQLCLNSQSASAPVPLSPDARNVWGTWYSSCHRLKAYRDNPALSRIDVLGLRAALAFAIDEGSPMIEPRHISKCIVLAGYWIQCQRWLSDNYTQSVFARLADALATRIQIAGKQGIPYRTAMRMYGGRVPQNTIRGAIAYLQKQHAIRMQGNCLIASQF